MPRHSQGTEYLSMYIDFGNHRIDFEVRFEPKPYFSVSVDPEGQVCVVAPEGKSQDVIADRVRKKAPWIIRQINYFEQFHPKQTVKSFVGGETHYYLGRQYRLKVTQESGKPQVRLKGKFFCISLADSTDAKKIENLLKEWYREHAKKYFHAHLTNGIMRMKRHGIKMPQLVVRTMRRRWGSCTKKGKILLNLELIKTPADCVEYVIIHELCHLVEHNHTEKFYRLLSSLIPNWKTIKEKLNNVKLESLQ